MADFAQFSPKLKLYFYQLRSKNHSWGFTHLRFGMAGPLFRGLSPPLNQKEKGMSELRLREFEELVLLSVLIASPDAHGPSLQQVLGEEAHRVVSLGAIYTALERLTRKGLVTSELGEPTPVRGGRRKRQYELTPDGLDHVADARRVRDRMWDRVSPDLLKGEVVK